ncbi:MAG TPA: siderophore-interacting protein, partial [Thermomicrobiales bacterium]|nr:siderophore-interacting protein [Thermomicrobiales bacterium]
PGHVLGIAGPRGSRIVGPGFDWYLLGGDETSIPSIARQIEMVGNHPAVSAFIEVTDAADEQDIPHVTWLHRGSAMPGATTLLQEALRTFVIPAGQGFVSVSGEATGLTPIRRMLVQEKGLNREYVDISGHWKRDTRNWDHHEAIPE